MHKRAICGLAALMLGAVGTCGIASGQTQTHDLAFGKHRLLAAFPCAPKLGKRAAREVEPGVKVFMMSLACEDGDHTYFLGVMEYPPELMRTYSVDELLDTYRQNVATKAHVKIRQSQRLTLQGFPAIRYDVLDTRTPVRELIMMAVLVDQTMLTLSVTARSGLLQSTKHASFANSLKITAKKK